MLREDLADGRPGGRLDLAVGVDEGQLETARKPLPHGGLASAHEPDQHDAARPEALADPRHARLPVVLLVFGKG